MSPELGDVALVESGLRAMLPGEVAVAARPIRAFEILRLHPSEVRGLEGAVPKRRAEFATGRACARAALACLGEPDCPIEPGADRAPVWPAGYRGSISHAEGMCIAAVARDGDVSGVGVDIESAKALDEGLSSMILRPDEMLALRRLAPLRETSWLNLAFSAKESFYKCYSPLCNVFIDFQEVRVCFSDEAAIRGTFEVSLVGGEKPWPFGPGALKGAWCIHPPWILTSALAKRSGQRPQATSLCNRRP